MQRKQQQIAFQEAQQKAAVNGAIPAFAGQDLATIGESLCCYVPRMLRRLNLNRLLTMSYEKLTSIYAEGSWAINDLIRLMERIADEAGVVENCDAEKFVPVVSGRDSLVEAEPIYFVPWNHDDESVSAEPNPLASNDIEQTSRATGQISSELETESCTTDGAMETEFDSMRKALLTHGTHPLLDEELREFLEPRDRDIPTKFLGDSVRELFEIPFARLAQSYVGRRHIDCLLKLLQRAVTSIHSVNADSDETLTNTDKCLRCRVDAMPRELHADGTAWRSWREAIHNAGMEHLRLGTVAESLRDLPVGLWDQPIANFTSLPLSGLAELSGVGPTRFESVVSAVRGIAVELMDLRGGMSIRLKFISGPLRVAQDWIERTLESRIVPDLDELVIRLLRPLAEQIRRDLAEREAQIAIHRLRLDESSTKPTLEELAAVYGVTRERIRQLEKWGPRVLQIRFPQGRYLLEALHRQFASVLGAQQQASFVQRIATLCFQSEVLLESCSSEVGAVWEEAGGLKLTPMTQEQIFDWSKSRLPMFAPSSVFEAIRSDALCWQPDARAPLWFARTEIDRILFVLYQQRTPVRLGELVLLDRVQNGDIAVEDDLTSKLSSDDERSLWGRIRRDPRFVECDDHHLLLPSESCGFERLDGQWMIQINLKNDSDGKSRRHLPVEALVRLVVEGMTKLGIVDATVAGVHRFASELFSKMFKTTLPKGITPLVLADMLVKLSDGLIKTMRRRRLRWDVAESRLKALGKRGWIGHVVTEFGQPLVLKELDGLLREHYQDYPDYVINQIAYAMDEDGDPDSRVQFVGEQENSIPTLVIPTSWKLDSDHDNVSMEILKVARRLASQVGSGSLDIRELKSVDWLKSVVERQLLKNAGEGEKRECHTPLQPANGSQKQSICPILVKRVGNDRTLSLFPIPAFIMIHGQRENGTINWKGKNTHCGECGKAIAQGESYAVEDEEYNGLRLYAFLTDSTMRRWCLKCIDYEHITGGQPLPTRDGPAPDELRFNRYGLMLEPAVQKANQTTPKIASTVLNAAQLAKLHLTTTANRVLSADFHHSVENLFGYAFSRILANAPAQHPWSLAELSLAEEDVDWLTTLFESTTASNVRQVLSGPSQFACYSRDAQFGAVLLLFESELARRHASEGQLWSAIHQQVAWNEDASRFLFNHRQPNARHKACLEAAAKELELRSAFGEDSAQEWYQSIFLQCGFSKKSFERRLPEWLGGQNTLVSIQRLLDDKRYSSSSFIALWTALNEYRHGKLERARLKSILESSPWVLHEWHDSLIELCRVSVKSSGGNGQPANVPFIECTSADVVSTRGSAFDGTFLGPPQLRSSATGLEFVSDLAIKELPDLADDACDVVINGRVVSTLLLQADGSLFITQNEIKLPTNSAIVSAELRMRSGERIAEQSLILWDDSDDVDSYVVKTGRRISPYAREFTERETLLIFKSDLCIEPSRQRVGSLANDARIVVRLLPNEAAQTRLFLGDAVLWEPAVKLFPAWRDQVLAEIDLRPRESPTQFRIRVTHPIDVTTTSCRFRRSLLEVRPESDRISSSEWVPLDTEIRSVEAITFTVLLRRDDEKTELRRRIPFRPPGNLWRRTDRWEQVPNRATSNLRELQQIDFRLSPPEAEVEGQFWQVFEGRRWIASVSERSQRFTDVEGWGAPLTLRTGPYNSCQPEQPLLRSATNTGLVSDATLSVDSLTIEIVLDRHIEPDVSHTLVVFDDLCQPTSVEGIEVDTETLERSYGCVWRATLPDQLKDRRVMALAIAYDGERLGSWWQSDWGNVLRRPHDMTDAAVEDWASHVADSARWLRLPLLSPDNSPQVREFSKAFPVPVLATWLSHGLSSQIVQDAFGDGWLCVVRAIYSDWIPTPKDARALNSLLESSLSDGTAFPLKTTMMALEKVSPLLAARVILAWVADSSVSAIDRRQSRAVVWELRKQLLGRETVESLTHRVAQDVAHSDVPPAGTLDFVSDSLLSKSLSLFDQPDSKNVTEVDRSNIEIAMRLDPYRTLVLVECLNRISKELE